jgi:TonB family protein
MMSWNESTWYALFLSTALKSVAVLGTAWVTAKLLRGRSAAARHLVWTAALAALLALPFLSISLPALRVAVAPTFLPSNVVFQATASAEDPPSHAQSRSGAIVALSSRPWHPNWRLLLMCFWAVGMAAGFMQMLLAWAAVSRIRRRASPITDPELPALARSLGIQHNVIVLETGRGAMPMTFGLLRPAIFIPSDAAQWTRERCRVVLLHELAHVRRGDIATNLLARTVLSLYWWNPLTWAAWREFLKERERAADDLVLSAGARASEYAGHLLEIARTMQSPKAVACAAIAMARKSELEGRLVAILDSGRNRKTPGRPSALAAALLVVSVVAPLAALHAQDDAAPGLPADVDATVRAAVAQKNHEMLDNAASAAERLQKYDIAQKLLESSLAIRGDVSGQQSEDYGMGLLKLANLQRRRGELAEAAASYAKAVSVLGNRPEAAPALIYLGTNAMRNKEPDQAVDYFQKAQLADPDQAGTALMWTAVVRQYQKSTDEAESLFKQALAIEKPSSPQAATTAELYALFLEQQGRGDESKSLRDQAAAVWRAQGTKATPARPDSASTAVRVGNGVTAPSVLYKVDPEYTEEARLAKYQGTVVVSAEIGTDGLAYNMKAIRGLGLGLDEKAIEAISQWKFRPGSKNGQPVPVMATIEVNFRLL